MALAFEDVTGAQPALPWRPGELRRVLEMVAAMAAALTPAPAGIPLLGDRLRDDFVGWRRLAAAHAAGDDDLSGLDPWAARHLDRLADLEAGWPSATEGPTLLHSDLRADNLLLTPTRVVAVDWPWASVGAAWVDLLLLLPSVTMQGGPDPEPTFAAHPVGRRRRPAGGDHRPGRLGRVPGRRVPPAAPARPAHPSRLPARAGRGGRGVAAAADRLALTAPGNWMRGRPNFCSRGAGPSAPVERSEPIEPPGPHEPLTCLAALGPQRMSTGRASPRMSVLGS